MNDFEKEIESVKEKLETVSLAAFEAVENRHERREKRLIAIIVLLIVLLVGTNGAWLYYKSQFELVEETTETVTTTFEGIEQDGSGTNNIVGGDYVNGATN